MSDLDRFKVMHMLCRDNRGRDKELGYRSISSYENIYFLSIQRKTTAQTCDNQGKTVHLLLISVADGQKVADIPCNHSVQIEQNH